MGFQGPTSMRVYTEPNFRGEKRREYPRAYAFLLYPPVYFLANDRDRETIGGDISNPSESFEYVQPQRHENKVHYVNFIPYRVQLNSLRVSRTWSGSDSKKLMKPPA